jgi:Ni/Co efflux regulator RcnB
MTRNLLLTAAAVVCLTLPAAAFADPPPDHGGGQGAQGQGQGAQDQTQHPGKGGGQGRGAQKGAQGVTAGQGHVVHAGQGVGAAQVQTPQAPASGVVGAGRFGRQGQAHTTGIQPQVRSPTVHTQQGQAPVFHGQTQVRRPQVRQAGRPPANVPTLGGWQRGVAGQDRVQAGQQWRQQHGGWDSSSPWRRNSNWWRGNTAFRLFSGARIGFFFIPAYGYVSVPSEYRVHYWRAGDQLPNWFWRYTVRDYWNYGLPQPPDGCAWVWVDNDVALIDLSDGYIIDIVHNVW